MIQILLLSFIYVEIKPIDAWYAMTKTFIIYHHCLIETHREREREKEKQSENTLNIDIVSCLYCCCCCCCY